MIEKSVALMIRKVDSLATLKIFPVRTWKILLFRTARFYDAVHGMLIPRFLL